MFVVLEQNVAGELERSVKKKKVYTHTHNILLGYIVDPEKYW